MTWPSRLTAVPTSRLFHDQEVTPSARTEASPEQLRQHMSQVPAVYQRLRDGANDADFEMMRSHPDPRVRAIGESYHHLFSPAGRDGRLEADWRADGNLTINRGHHRVEAARELGLSYLPVHVRAPDQTTLTEACRTYENEVAAREPEVVAVHRRLAAERTRRSIAQRDPVTGPRLETRSDEWTRPSSPRPERSR
ncbi:MAG: ParB/RepB/Spo0J family partition protein [Aeromicrobium sp.]|uniref:hypothetical protein n=1 Tax=Aeromicrobium sp. TaxID=1871063 RepID=UPI0039E3976C